MTLYGFVQTMRGVTFPLLKNEFQVSYNEQGLMVFMVSFTAVLFCVAAGIFIGRFGLKKSIGLGFVLSILGMSSFHFANGFWMAAGLYLVIQSGMSFFEIGLNATGVRIFTVNSGLMLNLLHFFYGAGAIIGPRFAGFITGRLNLGWQNVYTYALAPVAVMAIFTLITVFPDQKTGGRETGDKEADENSENAKPPEQKVPFWSALKEPMVWYFGVILGINGSMDGGSINWSGLYLQDVYGLDPKTAGAAFVSAFFVLYTLSRLFSGFFLEKFGYLNSLVFASFVTSCLYAAGFALGEWGIRILPVTGAFIALIWPTILAVSIGVFREKTQVMSGAIIAIAFSLSGLIQYGMGLTNRFVGEAWGYRSCFVHSLILCVLLYRLRRKLKTAGRYA
jgi:fucose permease